MRGVTPEVNPDSSWDMLDEEFSDPDFIPRDGSHEPSDEDPDEDSDEQFEAADGRDAVKDVDEDSLRDVDIEDLDEIEQGIAEFQHAEVAGSDTPPVENDPTDHDLEGRDPDFLFDGNLRPPEYYRQAMKSTNPDDFIRKEYAAGTEQLIVNTENQWRM